MFTASGVIANFDRGIDENANNRPKLMFKSIQEHNLPLHGHVSCPFDEFGSIGRATEV